MKKEELMKDLKFCQELMNRLVEFAEKDYYSGEYISYNHTPVQNDIVRLRRELNDVRRKLGE